MGQRSAPLDSTMYNLQLIRYTPDPATWPRPCTLVSSLKRSNVICANFFPSSRAVQNRATQVPQETFVNCSSLPTKRHATKYLLSLVLYQYSPVVAGWLPPIIKRKPKYHLLLHYTPNPGHGRHLLSQSLKKSCTSPYVRDDHASGHKFSCLSVSFVWLWDPLRSKFVVAFSWQPTQHS